MMRRIFVSGLTAATAAIAFTACGPAEVIIVAELGEGVDARPLNAVEVQLLPYDRDMLFDSLATAATRPEPEIPADLLAAQVEIADARNAWRDAETRWGILRDTLAKLDSVLVELNTGERRYQTLYLEWEDFHADYQSADRAKVTLFERFTGLQEATLTRMDSINFELDDWAAEAFVDVDAVAAAMIDVSGLDVATDTTEAEGSARLEVKPGDYWVYARFELPTEELYWNVPITVVRGEPLVVRLNRENADSRPIF